MTYELSARDFEPRPPLRPDAVPELLAKRQQVSQEILDVLVAQLQCGRSRHVSWIARDHISSRLSNRLSQVVRDRVPPPRVGWWAGAGLAEVGPDHPAHAGHRVAAVATDLTKPQLAARGIALGGVAWPARADRDRQD